MGNGLSGSFWHVRLTIMANHGREPTRHKRLQQRKITKPMAARLSRNLLQLKPPHRWLPRTLRRYQPTAQ
jgi:hypothetical protein